MDEPRQRRPGPVPRALDLPGGRSRPHRGGAGREAGPVHDRARPARSVRRDRGRRRERGHRRSVGATLASAPAGVHAGADRVVRETDGRANRRRRRRGGRRRADRPPRRDTTPDAAHLRRHAPRNERRGRPGGDPRRRRRRPIGPAGGPRPRRVDDGGGRGNLVGLLSQGTTPRPWRSPTRGTSCAVGRRPHSHSSPRSTGRSATPPRRPVLGPSGGVRSRIGTPPGRPLAQASSRSGDYGVP